MIFESYNIQHWNKNNHKFVFWVFPEQLLAHIIFERLHCYDITLVKKYNKTMTTKKVKERYSTKKNFIKIFSKSTRKKTREF